MAPVTVRFALPLLRLLQVGFVETILKPTEAKTGFAFVKLMSSMPKSLPEFSRRLLTILMVAVVLPAAFQVALYCCQLLGPSGKVISPVTGDPLMKIKI